jgi:hypothetical protein
MAVSVSQLSMAEKCGEQFRRRYIEYEKRPPGIALGRGIGLHETNRTNLRQKIKSNKDLPLSDMKDISRDAYIKAFKDGGGVFLTKEEIPQKKRLLNEGLEDTHRFVEVYAKDIAPIIQPSVVEEPFKIKVPELDVDLSGKMDHEKSDRIDDLKTASKKWSEGQINQELQAVFYSFVKEYRDKKRVPFYYHITIARRGKDGKPTSADYQEQHMTATDKMYQALYHRIKAFNEMIATGTFLPAPPTSWVCSERFCGYWHDCPYVGNGPIIKWF